MKRILVLALALIFAANMALAAGSGSLAVIDEGCFKVVELTATGDATTGAFVSNTTTGYWPIDRNDHGFVYFVEADPVLANATTTNMSVIINTTYGKDILKGTGTGISNATGSRFLPVVSADGSHGGYPVFKALTIYPSGNSIANGKLKIRLYIYKNKC